MNFKNWHDGGDLPEQLSCDRVWIQHEGVQESSKSRGGRRDGGRPQFSAARHASSQQSKYKIHSRMTQFYRKCICYKRFSFSSIRSCYERNVSWWWGVLLKGVLSTWQQNTETAQTIFRQNLCKALNTQKPKNKFGNDFGDMTSI